jgi:uncharacterized protein YndB with AHSA1/START domain
LLRRRFPGVVDVSASGIIPAPLERVWAWWTDFGEVGELFVIDHGVSRTRRRVLAREGDTLVLEERGAGPKPGILLVRHRVTILKDERAIDEEVTFPQRLRSRWEFRAEAEGTRVTRTLTLRGLARLSPAPVARRWIQRDLDAHVQQASAALTPEA